MPTHVSDNCIKRPVSTTALRFCLEEPAKKTTEESALHHFYTKMSKEPFRATEKKPFNGKL